MKTTHDSQAIKEKEVLWSTWIAWEPCNKLGQVNPVTRVPNGGVGVLISQRQETSHLSRLQCNMLAETLVLIPAVTAMLFPAHPRPLITTTDISAISKQSAKLSILRATQHLTLSL